VRWRAPRRQAQSGHAHADPACRRTFQRFGHEVTFLLIDIHSEFQRICVASRSSTLLGAAADMGDPNGSKQELAERIVARFHGPAAAADVLAWWRASRPVDEVHELRVSSGPIFQIVRDAGAATSGSDARRKIEQGGVRLGGERVSEPLQVVAPGRYELEVGKKLELRLVVEPAAAEAGKA
jgi:tyrosyl-tRNA synthetase